MNMISKQNLTGNLKSYSSGHRFINIIFNYEEEMSHEIIELFQVLTADNG